MKFHFVGEHQILIPEPINKSDILFINNKKEDAYWQREVLIKEYREIWFSFIPHKTKIYQESTLYDQDGNLISTNKEDSDYIIRIYEQEMKRRREGVFFKNGEQITYITGNHYFLLMWAKMQTIDDKDYADYREFQRDYFYLIDHTIKSPNILGLFYSKPKKTGITNIHWSGYYLNKATMTRNRNLGHMNINEGVGAKTFRDHFFYSYKGLPEAFKPKLSSFKPMDGSLIFGESFMNSKNKNKSYDGEDLNTSVFCVPTEPKAFDVAAMSDTWYDEPPKYKKSFGDIFTTNKEAVKRGGYIYGKCWLTSYTPDDDGDSFREAREVFTASELSTRTDGEGKTRSELINYHLPAYYSWIGERNDCFNKYGVCNEVKANLEIIDGRNKVKSTPRLYQAIIRQYANTKREAWSAAGAGSTFDNIRLGDILADIQLEAKARTTNDYTDGELKFENALWEGSKRNKRLQGQLGRVKFVPLTKEEIESGKVGKLRMFEKINERDTNTILSLGKDEWGNLNVPARFNYVGGVDPTQYAASSEVLQGSKNASYTMNLPDEITDTQQRRIATKIIVSEYVYRPENPMEFFNDLVKEIIYFGKLVIVEANVKHVATMLIEEGLGRYMLVRDKETGAIAMWTPQMDYQLISVTNAAGKGNDLMEGFVRLIKDYIELLNPDDKDYGRTIKSELLLQQLMDFSIEDTKIFDAVMAWGYTLYCLENYLAILLKPEDSYYNKDNIASALRALTFA